MRYPLITPQAVVPRCTCTHEDRDCGRVIKHFRHLPATTPCPAHGLTQL